MFLFMLLFPTSGLMSLTKVLTGPIDASEERAPAPLS